MSNIRLVHFYSGEDVVAEFTDNGNDTITLNKPLYVEVETFIDEGRQMLYIKEMLPQAITKASQVTIPVDSALYIVEISEDFLEQYNSACDFFYETTSVVNRKSKNKPKSEHTESKVVSILEAMLEKKDKPTH